MNRLKVLWLSNKVLSDTDRGATGTWLDALAGGLSGSGLVEVGNITHGPVARLTRQDWGAVRQWIVPSRPEPLTRRGRLRESVVASVLAAAAEFSPDLVHVWGMESFWGLLTARRRLEGPALLEMQGLKGAIAEVYAGGLSGGEQLACVGIKEILRGSTIARRRREFRAWGRFEREMIAGHRFITAQSDWLEGRIRAFDRAPRIFRGEFALRAPFHAAGPWRYSGRRVLFCSSAYPAPFKGMHVALRALAILKPRFPDIRLRVAGLFQRPGFRRDGYVSWLNRLVRRLGLAANIDWLGPLSASDIVAETLASSAVVLPSFIEGYSLALAEAMRLGAPAVVSFAGGAPSLARDGESALFFPPGDAAMCARQAERLLEDRSLAERISSRAGETAIVRNDPERIVRGQIEVYRSVLAEWDGGRRPAAPDPGERG